MSDRRSWLHALILSAVVAVFGVSFKLLSGVIGLDSPWLILLLMFDFLAIAKVAEPLFRLRMPGALRPLRDWEREGNVYPRFGVAGFGRLLRRSPLRYLNAAVYLDRDRRDLREVRLWAEASEASHFWVAVLLMPYIVFAAVKGMWGVVAGFTLVQLIVNVYPILHLRHVRGRMDRVLRRTSNTRAARRLVMSRVIVSTDTAPRSAAYSQAVRAGGLVFVSGQGPLHPATGELVGQTIQEQTAQCLRNVQAILVEAGSSLDRVVSATFLLANPDDFAGMNEEWLRWFPSDPPARQGAKLPIDRQGFRLSVAVIADAS
jgi:2-iminobutanoate/2-iminopropanoate deaminase